MDTKRPTAAFRWSNTRDAVISGNMPAGSVYSVQIPWHAGWRASAPDGRPVTLGSDKLGLMTVAPGCDGPCEVLLHFDGGTEMQLLRGATVAAWLFLAGWYFRSARVAGRGA
jgi:hypothetical protein